MATPKIGFGTKLYIGAAGTTIAQSSVDTLLGGVTNITGPEASANITTAELAIDSTVMYQEKFKSHVDPGDVTLTVIYDSTDADAKTLGAALASTARYPFLLEVQGSSLLGERFFGIVSGLGRAIARADVITRTVTIAVTGDPGYPTT